MLTNLATVVRAAGLAVVELPGWKTRTRPGSFAPEGVLCHHTGGTADSRTYVEWMTYTGRPEDGIPGPLCQLALSRTGLVYVCAAGRANHAGKCRGVGGWLSAGDGNAQLIGIEAMNTGTEGWEIPQYRAYVRLCAALCAAYRWPASHALGHKETSLTGKWDPGEMNMSSFRADVARAIESGGSGTTTPEDDDMTDAQYQQIIAEFRHLNQKVDSLRADLGVQWTAEMERDSRERAEAGTQWNAEATKDASMRTDLGVQFTEVHKKLDTVVEQTKPSGPPAEPPPAEEPNA